ncbi:hypothetical protein A3G67_00195 [Candidatus Roizmanbacteria bacterium RIFCSPLOWO2_12_FULL_40_12]|nr:MAG: hypothetical protein A2W49_04935 [Candidatus Roizmanbacteria bacterium RIFCSPHIGHO2_12_41_18]OGK60260.1 MAG: hypothetical protein A3G67_00195 [Candidatus Roizmanbacteria bacterium RIFCSPLOWO2_12_FULL_40_12]
MRKFYPFVKPQIEILQKHKIWGCKYKIPTIYHKKLFAIIRRSRYKSMKNVAFSMKQICFIRQVPVV